MPSHEPRRFPSTRSEPDSFLSFLPCCFLSAFHLAPPSSVLRLPPCLQPAPLRPDGGSFPSTRLFNSPPPPPPPTTTNDLSPSSPSPPRGASSNVRRSVAPSLLAPPFSSGQSLFAEKNAVSCFTQGNEKGDSMQCRTTQTSKWAHSYPDI